MPFLPFVVLLAWQAFSKSASFALGWATGIYFGQVPGKQGSVLAVISLASAAWVILVLGFGLPLAAGAVLDAAGVISRNFSVEPLHLAALSALIVLAPPAIVIATFWGEFHEERSVTAWLRRVPASYPATASLGIGVLQMVLFTPILLVQRYVRKQSLLQTAVAMRKDTDDDELLHGVAAALRTIGVERVEAEQAPRLMAWPMLTVGFAARHLLGAVVRGKPMRLRANGLQLFAYATNVAVLGPSGDAHRARAAIERELPFCHARVTWSDQAQAIEDAVVGAFEAAADDPDELHRRLEEVQARMDAADLNADEWNILYRIRLEAEHRSRERTAGGYRVKVRMANPATSTKATKITTSRATQFVRRSG
jgi:hypothetical protein